MGQNYELTEAEEKARDRVCIALDVSNPREADVLAQEIGDLVGMFKIGYELHTVARKNKVNIVEWMPGPVFLDLKFHDTPATVYGASKVAVEKGVYMFNVHIAGGEAMCKKALQGAADGAKELGIERPRVIGVTVLTSLNDGDLEKEGLGMNYDNLVMRRAELGKQWGLDGIVCPASKAGQMESAFGPDFLYITPGVEWKGKKGEGQKQLYTPDLAVQDCKNSILVIGSAITKAADKRQTAYEILKAMAPYV